MNWGLLVTNFILAGIMGVRMKGDITEWTWWVTITVFWIAMSFRDYFLKGGV